jgi:hypothetical protein
MIYPSGWLFCDHVSVNPKDPFSQHGHGEHGKGLDFGGKALRALRTYRPLGLSSDAAAGIQLAVRGTPQQSPTNPHASHAMHPPTDTAVCPSTSSKMVACLVDWENSQVITGGQHFSKAIGLGRTRKVWKFDISLRPVP